MKIIIIYIFIISGSFLFVSCSLSLGAFVAIDNALNTGPKEISSEKISNLKMGTKVTIYMMDSTSVSGTFDSYSEDKILKRITIVDSTNMSHSIN